MTAPAVAVGPSASRRAARADSLSRARTRFTNATGVTASGAALLAIAVLSWIVARIAGGRPLYLLAYGCLGVFLACLGMSRRPLPIDGTRSDSRPRVAQGETVSMEVVLTARRRLSTFILEEQLPSLLGESPRVAVASISPGESVSHSYRLTCRHRGVYELGPLVVKWGDPLGFTQRRRVLTEPVELLVHPAVEVVQDRPLTRMFEDPPIRPPVSKPWPSGLEFYGMRTYVPGDDLRRIVWRAYARTGQLLVRESEQGITDKITIVLDTSRRSHTRGTPSESFEAGVKAAASLGVRHLREGYSVTLEQNAARMVPPMRGGNSQIRILDTLARVERESEPLTAPIMRLVSDPSRDSHVIIITPRLDADAAGRLKLLIDRGTSVLVAALLWDEDSAATLGTAAALGCQVVEIRPNTPLAVSFRREIGAGR